MEELYREGDLREELHQEGDLREELDRDVTSGRSSTGKGTSRRQSDSAAVGVLNVTCSKYKCMGILC